MPDTASQPATEPEILPCTARKFSRQVNCNWVHPGASPCDARRKARAIVYSWSATSDAPCTGWRRFSRRFSTPFDHAKRPRFPEGRGHGRANGLGVHRATHKVEGAPEEPRPARDAPDDLDRLRVRQFEGRCQFLGDVVLLLP